MEEIPRVDGTGLDVPALAGKFLIVEMSASWTDSWNQSYLLYNELLAMYGSQKLAVVLVSLDHDSERLNPEPAVRTRGFELGWDPQGALAAKVQLADIPTVFIIDNHGTIVWMEQGTVTATQIRNAIHPLLSVSERQR